MKSNATKYELTDETRKVGIHVLHRIRALCSIKWNYVMKGDLGGFVESDFNLSHDGDCWIAGNAMVYESATVCKNARVAGSATVHGHARVTDNARVLGHGKVYGRAYVGNCVLVSDWAKVYGSVYICGDACVRDNAAVCGNATLTDHAAVCNDSVVSSDSILFQHVQAIDQSRIGGNASVGGNGVISGDAVVEEALDYLEFPFAPGDPTRHDKLAYTRSNGMWYHPMLAKVVPNLMATAKSERERRYYADLLNIVGRIENKGTRKTGRGKQLPLK